MIEGEVFRGRVSLEICLLRYFIRFKQKGNPYVHNVVFEGVFENGEGLEASFVFRSFYDGILGVLSSFRLPVLGSDKGSGYIDFSKVNFNNGLPYFKVRADSKLDYDEVYKMLIKEAL